MSRRGVRSLLTLALYWIDGRRTLRTVADLVEAECGLRDVEGLLSAVLTRKLSLVEVAALQFVAERLRGETPEPGANSDDITFGAKVELTLPESISASLGLDADPEA